MHGSELPSLTQVSSAQHSSKRIEQQVLTEQKRADVFSNASLFSAALRETNRAAGAHPNSFWPGRLPHRSDINHDIMLTGISTKWYVLHSSGLTFM